MKCPPVPYSPLILQSLMGFSIHEGDTSIVGKIFPFVGKRSTD